MSRRRLRELITTAPRRVAVTTFASNVARMRAVAEAAAAAGREVVVVGRAMDRVAQVAREMGYLDGIAEFRGIDVYGHLPPDKVVALCTGSQGEPRAALARIAEDQHPEVTFSQGDTVIFSSRTIPGNEKAVGRVVNGLVRQGIEVITDRTHLVHVSGHPRRAEMEELYSWVRPRIAIPVHGEALHLSEHAKLARAAGVREVMLCGDGDLVRLAPGRGRDRRGAGGAALQGRRAAGAGRGAHGRGPAAAELFRHRHRGARALRQGRAARRPGCRADRHSGTHADKASMFEIAYDAVDRDVRDAAQAAPARPAGGRGGGQARRARRDRRPLEKKPVCLVQVMVV